MMNAINTIIATELKIKPEQVLATIHLLDEGSTVPFIARYRKEATGGLDDTQLRQLEIRLCYLRELNDRKKTILKSIGDQGKLTEALTEKIHQTINKTELEDLYLPYKPKRRTKGQIAVEAGLTPLAELLWNDPDRVPETEAVAFIDPDKGVVDIKIALEGARYILMERFAEEAELLAKVRHYLWNHAHLVSKVIEEKREAGIKFSDYFDYHECINKIPSHRALAVLRGRNEGVLQLSLNPDPNWDESPKISHGQHVLCEHLNVVFDNKPADEWRRNVIHWTWRVKILLHMETDLITTLREKAEIEAIQVFANNVRSMLMAAPAGMRVTLGMDPGFRTGVKLAVVDATGKLLTTETIYPHIGQADKASMTVASLCISYGVELVAIGNGTASRETERFFADTLKKYPKITAQKVIVSEAGASVYSASELGALEFPMLDVSLRGAVSIARRLQDPMAELVKIEPKAIGVGQYQHDVSQTQLALKLNAVVEDCVNAVGVDLNTASASLLSRIAGLNKIIAQNIVEWRDEHGYFKTRYELLQVSRLGPKAFQQCAGFLRISNGDNPLDTSAVHPEAYPVVQRILKATQKTIKVLMGNKTELQKINASEFTDATFGLPTVRDILKELDKPGRDPRPEFKTATFEEHIETMDDLAVGMLLEGVVSNVTNFGAFVDIGVHQDGLVHISCLADTFVTDPHSVVKTGDIVNVKVTEIDKIRKRIALTMCLTESSKKSVSFVKTSSSKHTQTVSQTNALGAAFAEALGKLK